MAFKNLSTKIEKNIGWIIINRPDKLNALNRKTVDEMIEAFRAYLFETQVKAVILTGAGEKAFVAGADIAELAGLDLDTGKDYVLNGQELSKLMENFPKPVIAAINGFALGGGTEMALSCHVRIASENAKLGQPEVKLGLIPGFGGTQRLSRLVGKGRALELILTGKIIGAREALEIGLVNRVVPLDELHATCEALAEEMTANGPLALKYGIEAVNSGFDLPMDEALLLEAELFGKCCDTEDSKEGTQAFLEKRKPDFQGK